MGEPGEHRDDGKDGKHQLDDLNTLLMIQYTMFVTENTPFLDIYGDT